MKRKFHYAWLMLLACCSLMFVTAFSSTVFSNFLKPICDDLGFERTAFSMNYTIMGLVSVVSMTIVGRNLKAIGIKKFIVIGGTIIGLSFFAMSRATEIWHFYVCSIFIGMFAATLSILVTSIVLNNWFVKSKGFAIGLAMSCSGLSSAIFSPIVVRLIENSWRGGLTFLGVLALVFTIPVGVFIIRLHPSDLNRVAYGLGEVEGETNQNWQGVSYEKAKKQISFYTMFFAIFALNLFAGGYSSHFSAHMGSVGLSSQQIGSYMSIMAIVLVFAKISSGFIYDHLGPIPMTLLVVGASCITRLWIPSSINSSYFVFPVALLGVSLVVGTVFPSLYASRLFGEFDYGKICPLYVAASSIGYALSNPLYGWFFDRTGSYNSILYLSVAASILILLLIIFSIKSATKLREPKPTRTHSDSGYKSSALIKHSIRF